MKKFFAASTLALSLFGFSAFAQSTNKPTTSQETATKRPGDPIPGLDVKLTQVDGKVSKTIQTDANGQFEFSNLPPGRYLLTLMKDGHAVLSPRDHATGQASGKRQHGATIATDDSNPSTNTEASRTVNTSRSNIKNQKAASATDVTEPSETTPTTKAGISTSRSNIRNSTKKEASITGEEEVIAVQLFNDEEPVAKRAFAVPHILEKNGLTIEVSASGRVIGNVLKTRHDTVKNSINNVR